MLIGEVWYIIPAIDENTAAIRSTDAKTGIKNRGPFVGMSFVLYIKRTTEFPTTPIQKHKIRNTVVGNVVFIRELFHSVTRYMIMNANVY